MICVWLAVLKGFSFCLYPTYVDTSVDAARLEARVTQN
jgi:hypothetical protein